MAATVRYVDAFKDQDRYMLHAECRDCGWTGRPYVARSWDAGVWVKVASSAQHDADAHNRLHWLRQFASEYVDEYPHDWKSLFLIVLLLAMAVSWTIQAVIIIARIVIG